MKKNSALNKVTTIVNNALAEPESFLSVQPKLAGKLLKIIKKLYDDSDCEKSSKALKELYVDNCDEEQIWQQIELQNESSLISISQVLASSDLSTLPLTLTQPEESSESESDQDEGLENEEEKIKDEENSEMEYSDNDEELFGEKRKQKVDQKRIPEPSIVDDKFFKLNEMNSFLLKEDKKEGKTETKKSKDESDEESVDLFEDYPEDDDEDEEEEEDEDGQDLMYGDFFDSPEREDEKEGKRKFSEIDEDNPEEREAENRPMLEQLHKKRVKFNLTNDSDETDSLGNFGSKS